MIRKLKDEALSWTITQFIRSKFEPYGELIRLTLDSGSKQMSARFLLRGDNEPVDVLLVGYELREQAADLVLYFEELRTSREWLNQLILDLLPEKSFKLPPQAARYSSILKMVT
jgi:hypothetical protein